MKYSLVLAASALALTAVACQPKLRPAITKLDCPQAQGSLTLVSAEPGGAACAYRSSEGADISLRLMPVKGDPMSALKGVEDDLRALSPPEPAPKPATPAADTDAADADGKDKTVVVAGNATIRVEKDDDDNAKVDLPGIHVRTKGDGANVQVGPLHINTDGANKVDIRSSSDVRMKGEALSRVKRGVRAHFLLINEAAEYKVLGYEASGPRTGPLAVAVVKSRTGVDDDGALYNDVKRLVRRNGGT
jgi:hypothetical protein